MTKFRRVAATIAVAAVAAVAPAVPAHADPNPPPPSIPTLRNPDTGRCLQAAGAADGDPVRVAACTGAVNQRWAFTWRSGGDEPPFAYSIFNHNGNKCLQVKAADLDDNASMNQDECSFWRYGHDVHDPNQEWWKQALPGGGFSLANQRSGKCLTAVRLFFIPPWGGSAGWIYLVTQLTCDPGNAGQTWVTP